MAATMSNVLFLCPTHRDYREIEALSMRRRHHFVFHDYASVLLEELVADEPPDAASVADIRTEIARLVEQCSAAGIDAVVSSDDYPGIALTSVLAQRFGLPGVAAEVNLRCQHKYYSRLDQRRFVPEAVPAFCLLDEDHLPVLEELRYPVFLKPVKSFFSVGAYRADSLNELIRRGWQSSLQESFFRPFETVLNEYAHLPLGPRVIVEELLQGLQVTVEGYVAGGEIQVIGVVDSIMYPGTRSFQRFEYPSALPSSVQRRMADIAQKVMAGIGYDNGLFNIEMMYDPKTDSIHIIEINPRMASQFADLYEKVDGSNTYETLIDIALGKKPTFRKRQGRHRFAASCVLRTFKNAVVSSLPSEKEIEQVRKRYPDARVEVLATRGRRLSQEMQDGESFRYGIVSLGGRDRQDILGMLDECRARLSFSFDAWIDTPTRPARKILAQG